jgi:hypothetical protein
LVLAARQNDTFKAYAGEPPASTGEPPVLPRTFAAAGVSELNVERWTLSVERLLSTLCS